uniref:Uncharacterized protein n=1 Tax=Arundo donax TaxID=35708 RepID=A0A0A9H1B6_ARUDO
MRSNIFMMAKQHFIYSTTHFAIEKIYLVVTSTDP